MAFLKTGHRRRGSGLDTGMLPDIMAAVLLAQQFGTDWYVNSGVLGGASGDGRTPDSAFITLQEAVTRAAAGDRIYVAPGHAETVTSSSLTLSKAGVTIICLGNGLHRPTFTFSTAAATINVTAANVTWIGGHFIANFLNVASAFTTAASKDFALIGANFVDTSTILNFLSVVTTNTTDNAADGLCVVGCYWWGLAASPLAFISILGDLDRLVIENNDINLRATNDVGHFLTLTADTIRGARIRFNSCIVLGATNAAVGIFLTGSATDSDGIVAYNHVASLDTTAELIATAGTKLTFIENYYTGNADASGKLWPAVDAA